MKILSAAMQWQSRAVLARHVRVHLRNWHTVTLPPRAPKQLLLDLKDVFLRYPGREKVQLKIGEQLVALPVTVTMSPLLEQRIDEVLGKYSTV